MGIGSLLGSALKSLPWNKIAVAVMEQAPDLYQKARERFSGGPGATAAEAELQERVARLEEQLNEQEELLVERAARCTALEERCATLEGRLRTWRILGGILFVALLFLLAVR